MAVEPPSIELFSEDQAALRTPGQPHQVFATVDGVEVAIVPAAEYRELVGLRMKAPFAEVRAKAKPGRPRTGLSTIERDPEVADFLVSRFRGGVTVQQILDVCRNTFGAERTPSHARIQRFRQRLSQCR